MAAISLKDKYGRVLAVIDDGQEFEAVETGEEATIDNKPAKRVAVQTAESVETGYVETEVLEQLTEETVAIPANFNGMEAVMVPTRIRDQLFEITDVTENDGYVEVTALHIFYRQRMNSTTWEPDETTKYSGAAACRNVMTNVMYDLGFNVASDSTDLILGDELDYARKNIVEAFLDPASGICEKYKLSLIRDNDVFYCLKNVGYDRGFVVQTGKNLLGVERTESIENVITRVAPIGRDADGNFVWMNYLGSNYVDSYHLHDYASPRLEILYTDLEIGRDGVTAGNIHEKLYEKALERFSIDEVDVPEVTMTIRFISLGDTEEYSQYRDLDKVYLYDIIHIDESERGYKYAAQVIGVEHNILTGRLESATIGTPKKWDGVRTVATWRIPEISGSVIRQNTIRSGSFQSGAIKSGDIANGAINGSHFSASGQSAVKNLALEQLIVENTSPDGLLYTRFAVVEGEISSSIQDLESSLHSEIIQTASQISLAVENELSDVRSSISVMADEIRSDVSAANSTIYSTIQQTASNIRSEVANAVSGVHSVINQTASNIQLEVSKKNAVYSSWDNPSQSHDAQTGDIWIKTNGIRTYGKAGEFTWDTLGGYAWADFYGSEIYVLDENGNWVLAGGDQLQNISRTLIDQTDEHIALITDSMSGDYAEFIVDIGRIHSRVADVENGLTSVIEQTASMIRSAVWTANSTMYSEILQTQSMIRSEVANVDSNIRSTITQTASGIWTEVGRKATVYTQWGDPSQHNTIHDGDIWIKANNIRSWLNMETYTWNAMSNYKWSDFYGSIHYVWENGGWKEMASEQLENITHAEHEVSQERIRNIVEDMNGNYSEFLQEKNQIRSTVRNLSDDLGSSIRQTASEIRSDVWAAKSTIYSSISQTASQIRAEVGNAVSNLRSSITQNADRISLVVEGTGANAKIKPASIVAAINNGASSVVISADHVNLNGYVTATNFSTVLANLNSAHIQRLYVDANIYGPNGNSLYTLGLMGVSLSGPSNNVYTLKQTTFNGTESVIGTFSRAISSWTWGGGSGKINVKALPQNQTKSVNVSISGATSVTSNGTQTYTVMYENSDGDDVSTGATLNVSVNISPGSAEAKTINADVTSGVQIRSTAGGSSGSYRTLGMYSDTYTPQGVGSSHDCIVVKDGNNIVGRYDIHTIENGKYNLGWNDCRAQFLTSITTLWSVKTRTMTIDDVGREFYIRDTSYTAYTNDPGTRG